MRGRSWMAGVMLSTSLSTLLFFGTGACFGQTATEKETPSQKSEAAQATPGQSDTKSPQNTHSVRLVLQIAGLGADGCDVEIKPGNPTCRFRPLKRHVNSSGLVDGLIIKDIEIRGADRNCSFAITVIEPGQKSRTILRGFRMAAAAEGQSASSQPQTFACVLSAPSKLARLGDDSKTRK